MAHIPHLLVEGPWPAKTVPLDRDTLHHLHTVLRRTPGDVLSYTDGRGRLGQGSLGDGTLMRGDEQEVEPPTSTVVATAPPASRDRARFLVEKLAELGVAELRWLRTRHGEGRAPTAEKSSAWCRAALEQSRGAWLMRVTGPVTVEDLPAGTVFADVDGPRTAVRGAPCVAVGPEGGWAPGELPERAPLVSLAATVLRVETAAIAAAIASMEPR